MNFFRPIVKKLLRDGHEVRILATGALPAGAKEDGFDTYRCDWHLFNWERIESFEPTRILTFNGGFRPIHAAVKALRQKYDFLFAEVAWFTQNDFIYIDRDVHHRSTIAGETPRCKDVSEIIKLIKSKYVPKDKLAIELPEDFVLVPLQLERDTSILYASDYFKDMNSLIGFVRHHLDAKIPVVVKTHPKRQTDEVEESLRDSGCILVNHPEVTMTDLVSRAKLVVGINSTSLMEALVLGKPIVSLGNSVAGHDKLSADSQPFIRGHVESFDLMKVYNNPTEFMPSKEIVEQRIAYLYANQIDFRSPPSWAADRIISGDTTPRTVDDFLSSRGQNI
jgi:hypothetical protein